MKIPDGFIVNNLIVFGNSLSSETVVSRGFFLELPDTKSLSTEKLNLLHHQIKILLAFLGDDYSMQIQWYVDNDYINQLENYRNKASLNNKWTEFTRLERYNRYSSMMKEGHLRKEKLIIFLSKKCSTLTKKPLKIQQQIETILDRVEEEFNEKIKIISEILNNAFIKLMDAVDYFALYKKFFNPSLNKIINNRVESTEYNPEISVLENTLRSDGISTKQEGYVFFKLDDYYHSLIVLRRWPRQTHPGIINHLTNALSLDYIITQNVYPIPLEKEIEREEKEIEWLEAVVRQSNKISLLSSIAKKERKLQSLMNGYILPYNVLTVVRIWDQDLKGLATKTQALKASLGSMNGAQYHQVNHPGQAQSVFFETFPGWTGGRTRAWDLYAQNDYLCDLLPISSTFTGALNSGEAIYDGINNNLIGIETFSGNSPQHAVLIGMTGSGKSIAICDLLSQTESFYDFTAIIEEGLSYGVYTQLMGYEPIIIHPNNDLTINYLDTQGLPLSDEQIGMAASLCLKMIGFSDDESLNNMRLAIITEYINQLYWEKFEEWQYLNDKKYYEICRMALSMKSLAKNKKNKGQSQMEIYSDAKELYLNKDKDFLNIYNSWTEKELCEYSKDFNNRIFLRNLAYGYFDRKDYPQHSQLVESMKYAKLTHHDAKDVDYLATLLSIWCKNGGKYGSLFDGTSNINLKGRLVHFELGYISDSESKLKEAVGFLISNYVRQHVITLPRGVKKRIIFEEASRFMNVPGGPEILAEAYAQLRKYGCWVLCVTQQYGQLKKTNLRSVIFGNSKLFLLMKQNDRKDLQEIAEDIGLPDTAQDAIMSFTLPEHQKDSENRCSYMGIFSINGENATFGVAKIRVSEAMLYVASSNGKVFDERSNTLKQYDDAFEGVMKEVYNVS